MALLKCPECGNNVSSEATACPHCGYPVEKILNVKDNNLVNNGTKNYKYDYYLILGGPSDRPPLAQMKKYSNNVFHLYFDGKKYEKDFKNWELIHIMTNSKDVQVDCTEYNGKNSMSEIYLEEDIQTKLFILYSLNWYCIGPSATLSGNMSRMIDGYKYKTGIFRTKKDRPLTQEEFLQQARIFNAFSETYGGKRGINEVIYD